jgi:hypothetical protein
MSDIMLHQSRINAKKKRAPGQKAPSAHLAQILFRMGEFGAVGFFVFAAVNASHKSMKAGVPIDVYILVAIGIASFVFGWAIRWALTGNTDIS